jgi:hypothetical protein
MSKILFALAFAAGLAVVAWTGFGFVGTGVLPLLMTVGIAATYLLGAFELRQFRAATAGLRGALDHLATPPATLPDWLERVPGSLRDAVRLRVEAERGVLPGPALTPYLVGLLVMLGMLGTFLGMVVTFKGAVFALQGSTDLQAIRGALAEPIKGLGLSFGTSVAGVAASAMLGLMSAISRRERVDVARLLDARIAGVLQRFSLVHQRQEAFRSLQAQAQALPDVVTALQALVERIEVRSRDVDEQLVQRHERFQQDVTRAYGELARSVGDSLQHSLAAGTRAAGEAIAPVVDGAMRTFVQETQRTHERLGDAAQEKVDALLAAVDASLARTRSEQARADEARLQVSTQALQALSKELQDQWRRAGEDSIARQQKLGASLEQTATKVSEQAAALSGLWRTGLEALREDESRRGQAAVDRLGELQGAVTQHLATLGAALEAPLTRLLQTASEVPQAAAGVITQLREEMSRVAERDNLALHERTALLGRFGELLQAVNEGAQRQRSAIEAMVASASSSMEQASTRFAQVLDAQATRATAVATQVQASAVEVASLAEAFQQGMQLFQAGNEKLAQALQQVEASLTRSTTRSDEQLAYYVAQAREVVDLSIASQQGLIDNLRQLHGRTLAVVEEERA